MPPPDNAGSWRTISRALIAPLPQYSGGKPSVRRWSEPCGRECSRAHSRHAAGRRARTRPVAAFRKRRGVPATRGRAAGRCHFQDGEIVGVRQATGEGNGNGRETDLVEDVQCDLDRFTRSRARSTGQDCCGFRRNPIVVTYPQPLRRRCDHENSHQDRRDERAPRQERVPRAPYGSSPRSAASPVHSALRVASLSGQRGRPGHFGRCARPLDGSPCPGAAHGQGRVLVDAQDGTGDRQRKSVEPFTTTTAAVAQCDGFRAVAATASPVPTRHFPGGHLAFPRRMIAAEGRARPQRRPLCHRRHSVSHVVGPDPIPRGPAADPSGDSHNNARRVCWPSRRTDSAGGPSEAGGRRWPPGAR